MTRRNVSAPRLSGRFRSSSTTEGVSRFRKSRPADSRVTQFTLTGVLHSIRRRRTRSASPRLSSISNTFVVGWRSIILLTLLFSLGWQVYRTEPEFFDGFDRGKKLGQISRLVDVTVGAHFVAANHVLAQLGGAEDHDRDAAQLRTSFHRGQYCQPVPLRQVQVEDDQVGPLCIRKAPPASETSHRFYAVFNA